MAVAVRNRMLREWRSGGFRTVPLALTFTGDVVLDSNREDQQASFTDFAPRPGGAGIWPAYTNKVTQSVPGADADTNITVGGDVLAVLSKVVDAAAPVANASGEVWEFDNSAGSTDATADFAGATGATTAHSISISAKVFAGAPTLMLGTAGVGSTPVNITATEWPGEAGTDNRTKSANITPAATDLIRVTVPAGCVVRFVAPQLQTGSIVTPWRRTDGSSASTTAGRIQQPVAGLFTATQGWVVARIKTGWASTTTYATNPPVFEWRDDDNNRFNLEYATSDDAWQMVRGGSGTFGNARRTAQSFAAGAGQTVIGAWNATQVRLSDNGNTFASASSAVVPTMTATSADIGRQFTNAAHIDSNVLWYATGSGTLTDADAAVLNSYTQSVPGGLRTLRSSLNGAAKPTSYWGARTARGEKAA